MSARTVLAVAVFLVAVGPVIAASASADPFIYYGSNNGSGIGRANLDGSGPTNIVAGEFAASLAVDADHIYFKSLSNAISRTNIDGTGLDSNFITLPANAVTIKEIEVNATHVFWTDDFNNAIGRARIAGTCTVGTPPCDLEPAWIPAGSTGTGDGGISGLAISDTHIYWTRVVAGAIGRADINGTGRDKDFITGINNVGVDQAPFDVDVNATHIYWTDGPESKIGRAQLNGSGPATDRVDSYLSNLVISLTAVEVNDTHVFWATDGGEIGRARVAGTCTTGTPPCDVTAAFIGGGNQLRSVALGLVPEDVVVTDCDAAGLATVTEVTGDLIVQDVAGCDGVELPELTEVAGDVVIDGNTAATTIDIGSLVSVGGSITITDNTSAQTIDIGSLAGTVGGITITDNTSAQTIDVASLATVTGSIDITDNTDAVVIDVGSLVSVTGSIDLDTAGTNVDVSGIDVDGDLTVTANGSDSVAATTAGGVTDIEVLGGSATMHVVLPAVAFAQAVNFTIQRQGDSASEAGATASGTAAVIDPVAGYRFAFDVPTLVQNAQLQFTINLAQLDAATRAAVLAGAADQTATLVVRPDGSNQTFQARARCGVAQEPAADGCVNVVLLGVDGQPVAAGTEPAFVRFEAIASHFSTYAVALVKPVVAPPGTTTTTAMVTTPSTAPTKPKPSNAFKFGKLNLNRRQGTATLTLGLPGSGSLVLKGTGLRVVRRSVVARTGKSITVKLRVRTTGTTLLKLKRTGRVRVKVTVAYTPTGGDVKVRTKSFTVLRTVA